MATLIVISPYWDTVTITAFITAIMALGLYISNSAGALSVAHAAVAGMAGYLGGVLTTNFGWPFAAAIVSGAALGLAVGVGLAIATLRMNPLVAGLTTLAFGETMVVVATNISYIGGSTSFYGIPPETTYGVAAIALAAGLACGWLFDRSELALHARACRDDITAAAASGVRVRSVKLTVFSLGAGLTAVGGVLNAHDIGAVAPSDLGFQASLQLVIIWVFGGSYVFWGPIFGALVLTFLPEVLRFSSQERLLAYGLLLTIVVLLRPEGLIVRVPLGRPSPVRQFIAGIRGRVQARTRTPRNAPVPPNSTNGADSRKKTLLLSLRGRPWRR